VLAGLSEARATSTTIVGTIITGTISIALPISSLGSMGMTITGMTIR
jgi:hypothetical protein